MSSACRRPSGFEFEIARGHFKAQYTWFDKTRSPTMSKRSRRSRRSGSRWTVAERITDWGISSYTGEDTQILRWSSK
ncbi:hypothetical protein [Pseudoclavibacter sp. AY1H1]|uniref:hypothetical protein n=1 Tax=Pseudoclavibacter sp. AY1H1 TaxID=2080584 RepID=UPI000CE859BE|nr:hypothetical protein [Pseudoclavibacter sp. AY1H1]PPF39801.1 hypothetical protein C5E05_00875 [Pseudoclavibacter sp. AY1H1]